MSLVVAQRHDNRLSLVADTSTEDEVRKDFYKPGRPGADILKALIIRPDLVIAIAGKVIEADRALFEIRKTAKDGASFQSIVDLTLRYHVASRQDAEFILMSADESRLVQVTDGSAKETVVAWIGSAVDRRIYQEHRASQSPISTMPGYATFIMSLVGDQSAEFDRIIGPMQHAMLATIADHRATNVGGFCTSVGMYEGAFRYFDYVVTQPRFDLAAMGPGEHRVVWGRPEMGDYTIAFCASAAPKGTECAVIVPEGRFGLHFIDDQYPVPRSKLIRDVSPLEFEEAAEITTGVRFLCPITHSHEMWKKSEKAFSKKQVALSFAYADLAVERWPKDAACWFFRGRARGMCRDPEGAIADFKEAIRLEPKKAIAHAFLAIAYRDYGDLGNAREEVATALKIDPNLDVAQKLSKELHR